MADTRRELILARMKSNLDSITGATVYRSRVEPLARGEVPAVIIEPVNDQPNDTNFFDQIDWTMRVRITTLVRASVPDDTSDTYTQQVHSLLMADQTVNGYALDLTPDRTEFSLYEADVPLGVISMDYLVRYRSSRTDLTSA
nr:phage minor tail protein U [uncultured Mediterranean phage uvMED]